MHAPYPRTEIKARICDRVAAGWILERLGSQPGFPSASTVGRWVRADAGFGQRLDDARAWRRGLRAEARVAASFSEVAAEAFLLRVRRGERVRALVRDRTMPGRAQLNRWKRERPDFALRLTAACRFSRELRPTRWARYDEAVADRIVVRFASGETMPSVLADPTLPGVKAVRRWRRLRPEFDAALRSARLAGHRARMRARRKLTPELEDEIAGRIVDGASLKEVCRAPDMPAPGTLHKWMRTDPGFADAVRSASRFRDEAMMDAALEIAMAATDATVDVARARIGKIHQRLGRMAPKRGRDSD